LVYRRQDDDCTRRKDPAARRGLQLISDAVMKKKGDAMISTFLRAIATAALLLVPQTGWSVFDPVNDVTDIFLANPALNAERTNVLIFIDHTPNWNQAFDTEKAGL